MSSTSTANSIVVNSVASTNSQPTHVYTSQSNISTLQPNQQSTNVVTSLQSHHQPQQQYHQQTQHLQSTPQITQIQTIPAQPNNQIQHQQQRQQVTTNSNSINSATSVGNNVSSNAIITNTAPTVTSQNAAAQGNTKEKCRKFLANLIDLSTREPKPVEKNVRNLIQELVNANVEPEEFCDRLERLLNASPQPCLIGFLKV